MANLINFSANSKHDHDDLYPSKYVVENDISAIKTDLPNKISRTDTRTFFLEPKYWSEDKYILDISDCGWTAKSILQLASPNVEINAEAVANLKIGAITGSTLEILTESTPDIPVILTIVYAGEDISDVWVDDSIGTKKIPYIVYEEKDDPDTLVLLNAEEGLIDSSIYGHAVSEVKENTTNTVIVDTPSGQLFGSKAYTGEYAYSYVNGKPTTTKLYAVIAVDDFDFTSPWQIEVNSLLDCSEVTCDTFTLRNNSDDNVIGMVQDIDSGDEYESFYLSVSPTVSTSSYNNSAIDSFDASALPKGTPVYTILQFDGGSFRWIVKDPDGTVLHDNTVEANSTTISNLSSVNKIRISDIDSSAARISVGSVYVDEFRLRKVLTEAPETYLHINGNEDAYKKTSLQPVEYEKEVTVTEPTWYRNTKDGLQKYDLASGEWVKA